MKKYVFFTIMLACLCACGTSEGEIQTTTAPTDPAAATIAPTVTLTPLPSATPQTMNTPFPIETLEVINLIDRLNYYINLSGEEYGFIEILEIKFDSNVSGERDMLKISVRCTLDEYDQMTGHLTAQILGFGPIGTDNEPIDETVQFLNIDVYDNNFDLRGIVIYDWSDIVAFANEEITADQLLLRAEELEVP